MFLGRRYRTALWHVGASQKHFLCWFNDKKVVHYVKKHCRYNSQ